MLIFGLICFIDLVLLKIYVSKQTIKEVGKLFCDSVRK